MIGLTKNDEPAELAANKEAWTEQFARDRSARPYAHAAIREALRTETYSKCAYCESRMEHVAPSNVEHIKPKTTFPELVVDWNNLTLACTVCNTRKGTYYDAACEIINPYRDNPSDHFYWVGPLILEQTQDRGRITITRLDLNRAPLLYERAEHLRRVGQLLAMIEGLPDAAKAAIREDVASAQRPNSEYSSAVTAFVEFRARP